MIRVHALKGTALRNGEGNDQLHIPEKDERLWVEAVNPTPEESKRLQECLGIHELALEDALTVGHPPKMEDFGDHLFLIAHTPDRDSEEGTRKIAVLFGKTWIVTILRTPLARIESVLARLQREPARYLQAPAVLAHALLDYMTDGFEEQVETLRDQVEELEEKTLRHPEPAAMTTVLELRHEVGALARTVRSQRDVCQSLTRIPHPALPKKVQPYLRDVYDHLVRVHDLLEGVRDTLGSARDAYLSSVNNRLSEVMRVLTVIATIMMPLGLIAGIYGMNFQEMPLLESHWGFWIALGGMTVLGSSMLYFFRRRGWL